MLKPVNFQDPELYKLFKVKRPTTKKEVYLHQLDKLQVLISLYDRNDFDQVKFYNLNIDQKLAFLENESFLGGMARKEKVIEALTQVAKSRDIKLFEERTEILTAVKSLALNHDQLSSLSPQSYVTSLIHSSMKMRIESQEVWASLASYVLKNHHLFDVRSLSNIVYSFQQVSQGKPILHNYDDFFADLELPLIKKLDAG